MKKEELFLNLLKISDYVKPPKKTGHKKDKENFRLNLSSKVILILLLKEKKINQRSISKNMKITAQGVSELLKSLVENELILKQNGLSHNENLITLTEKGEILAKQIYEEVSSDADIFFDGLKLSNEELLILDILITKILNAEDLRI